MGDVQERFSRDYAQARERFRAATAALPHGALEVVDGLTIDWAWQGDPAAERCLVFSSGLHGIEGFAGSAVQLEMLSRPTGMATLHLHVLNPWGMANLRRVNECNVDLNRNFLPPGQAYSGGNDDYALVNHLLNPPGRPVWDGFLLRVGIAAARFGYGRLKNALMSGQHEFPRGLQYAGAKLEEGPRALLGFLDRALVGKTRIVHVDLHVGRGAWGTWTPLLDGGASGDQVARARAAFGDRLAAWNADDPVAYVIKGGLTAEVQRRYAACRYDALTVEFGTYGDLKLLAAFRDENRWHHFGDGSMDHAAKRALLEGFCPADSGWRAGVVAQAGEIRACAEGMVGGGEAGVRRLRPPKGR
jgi:hypothetical protein